MSTVHFSSASSVPVRPVAFGMGSPTSRTQATGAASHSVADVVQFSGLSFQRRNSGKAAPEPKAETQAPAPELSAEAQAELEKTRSKISRIITGFRRDNLAIVEKTMTEDGEPFQNKRYYTFSVPGEGRLMLYKREDDSCFFWLDMQDLDHPYLNALSERFSFHPFPVEDSGKGGSNVTKVELPVYDTESVQLTAYSLGPDGVDMEDNQGELIHLYAGKNFLISTHDFDSHTLTRKAELLEKTQKYMGSEDLVSSIINDLLARYGRRADAFEARFEELSKDIDAKKVDHKKVQGEFGRLNKEISHIYKLVLQQKRVLEELGELNDFHEPALVKDEEIKDALTRLEKLQGELQTIRKRHSDLHDAYQNNRVIKSQNRVAALGFSTTAAVLTTGAMGMNVPIPGDAIDNIFWWVLSGSMAASAGVYQIGKRIKLF